MSTVRIDIASEFTGRKAFKDAELATGSLDKAVTSLGKKMAGAFSAYKIAQFGKDSVKAFMDDQKAAAALANQLKNVGLALSTGDVEKFIAKMQDQTGILDDQLRPAYAQLVRVMGSTTETQKALATAFDVSSGTGADFQQVVDALSQAFVGNTKGLKALNTGLTQNELKTKSYGQIVDILNKKFAGAGAAAVDTYAGKIKLLNVAVENAKETIGQGFVDAFTTIANDGDFKTVTTGIENMATYVADTIRGLGSLMDTLNSKTPDWLKRIAGSQTVQNIAMGPLKRVTDYLNQQGIRSQNLNSMPSGIQNFLDEQKLKPKKVEQAKAEAAAIARAKQLKAAIDAQNKAQAELVKKKKEAAALDALQLKYLQAQKIFNEEQIQIAAALQNKGLTAEDQLRLNLKKDILDLETAIQNKDVEGATALAAKIELEYKQLGLYQAAEKSITSISDILKNFKPMDLININNLIEALNLLAKLNIPLTPQQQAQQKAATAAVEKSMDAIIANVLPNAAAEMDVTSYLGTPFNPNIVSNYGVGNPNLQNVTVTIVDNTSGLIDVVTNATQQASANGINTRLIRNTGGLSW